MAGGSWIGIDIGTSGVKAALIDESGAVRTATDAPLSVSRPRPGWSEQAPDDWWTATLAAMDALAAAEPALMRGARGIGLSGQMHGATLLDAADRPLRPCILWNDARSGAECAALDARADFRGIGGNLVMAGFTAPKLEWVRVHEPEIFAQVATVLLPKDYVRLLLTGERLSDMSDAAGTLWMDVGARDWSDALLEATHLSRAQMPGLVEGSAPAGRLRPDLAARWGMAAAPVVAGGGGDNAASACGVGAVRPGEGFLSIGTSGVLFLVTERFAPNTDSAVHAFCHAIPDTWHQMGVILSAADSLSWLGRITGRKPADLAASVDPAAEPDEDVLFLPYLSGERTPLADPDARGAFIGLSQASGPEALARAVLEGVAFAFADCADALKAGGAGEIGTLAAVGGGAHSDTWLQMTADATGLTLARIADSGHGAALGAARLGFCAAEGADPREVRRPAPVLAEFAPDPARADAVAARRARYRAAWPALRALRG
ncbi:MAG: xylulokinase [Rubrimonas sp.]|uniref:xylulokinase n=1 Tax=Rubrimonas sp. TaxID=2036015 RepID=UPI002FDCFB19